MLLVRSTVLSFTTFFFFALFLPSTGSAREAFFESNNCSNCHAATARTCNGCHVHGTHPNYNAVGTLNLKATTDTTTYVEGDPISVTLEGGNLADFSGWVGVRVYDASGTEVTRKQLQLGCMPNPTQFGNKCDLPMTLSVPAQLGWTKLYMSWAGNEFDRTGAAYGTLLGNAFGVGRRPLKDGSGNQVTNHIEEIVATGLFVVTPAPPQPTPTPAPDQGAGGGSNDAPSTSTATSTTKQEAGAGALDLSFSVIFVFAGLLSALRAFARQARGRPRRSTFTST
jgi:hypothetical protein